MFHIGVWLGAKQTAIQSPFQDFISITLNKTKELFRWTFSKCSDVAFYISYISVCSFISHCFIIKLRNNFLQDKLIHTELCLFSGTAGDSLDHHRGSAFSTKDRDNDANSAGSCALIYKGAWWYNNCHVSNLNGLYLNGKISAQGMVWYDWKNSYYSVKKSEMKIRPKDF